MTKKPKNVSDQGEVLPRIKTQLTANLYPKDYEENHMPSETIPGQSMSVLEMVKRHRMGLPIDGNPNLVYTGEELKENLDDMDEVDKQAYMDSVADYLVEVRARLDESAKTKEQKAFLDAVDEQVRKKLAEMNDRNKVTDIKPGE